MFRQGDILIEPYHGKIPSSTQKRPRDKRDRIVLAEGEATGHAHAIAEKHVECYELEDGSLIVTAQGICILKHEEHSPIQLRKGNYRVTRQREYQPEEIHFVAD